MSTIRTVALALASTLLGLTAVALASPAHADTTWGCGGCVHGKP